MTFQIGNKEQLKGDRKRPFKTALLMELAAAEQGRIDPVPKLSARAIVRAQLQKAAQGDAVAFQAIADRVDGKVPQAVVGDDEHPALFQAHREWLAWMVTGGVQVVANNLTGPQFPAQLPRPSPGHTLTGFDQLGNPVTMDTCGHSADTEPAQTPQPIDKQGE